MAFTGRCPAISAKLSKSRTVRGMKALQWVFPIRALLMVGDVFLYALVFGLERFDRRDQE